MRPLCVDVQNDKKYCLELEKKFELFVKWYRDYYSDNNKRLSDILELSFMGKEHPPELKANETDDVNTFYTKVEPTLRILLSLYSKGPIGSNLTWMGYIANFNVLIDLVNKHLIKHNEGKNLALAVFLDSRIERNGGTHCGTIAEIPSFIRMLNVYREMLVFLDPDLEGLLPRFDYPKNNNLDIQWFLSDNKLDPSERTLVLIAGTLHDLPLESRKLLANIPWTVVIDLDAASEQGGLYEAVDDKTRVNRVLWTTVENAPARTYGAGFIATEWYSCGDFIGYNAPRINDNRLSSYFTAADQHLFASKKHNDEIQDEIEQLYMETIQSLSNSPLPVTIVHIDDDFESVMSFLPTVKRELRGVGYSFMGVYPTKQYNVVAMSGMISRNMKNNLDKFNYFCCDLPCFFTELNKYKNHLPLIHSTGHSKTLPSRDDDKDIPINRIQSLNRCFDVLYSGCDHCDDPEKYQSDKYDFRSGKIAPWSIFGSSGGAVSLFEYQAEHYKKIIVEKLKKADKNNIVRIEHEPGIGGTTFCRKLCHSLHHDWPVVCAMSRNISEMAQELDSLYDFLKKGIIVLVDNMEASDVEKLSSELYRSQTKPFCIVTGVRKSESFKQPMPLSLLNKDEIDSLRRLYYEVSELPDKNEKDKKFNTVFSDPHMCNPFMIALYFLEENFYGVNDYVSRSLKASNTDSEKKAIAYTALFHIYNGKSPEMPEGFAKYVVGLAPNASYLNKKEYAKSLLISNKANITSKHFLISKEILRQTAVSLYGMPETGDYTNYLYKFAEDFIEDFFGFLLNRELGKFSDEHFNILRGLFTTSENENGDSFPFSKLISDVGLNNDSEAIFDSVIKRAEECINHCGSEDDKNRLYLFISHLYGHMGRFYRAPMNTISRNLTRSEECATKSIEYMELGQINDPFIYHMSGEAFRIELKDKIDKLNRYADEISADERQENAHTLESLFLKAVEMYEHVIDGRSYQYGYMSMLHLYIDFVGNMYYSPDDSSDCEWLLEPEKSDEYHNSIESIIDTLGSLELSEEEVIEFNALVDRYDSGQYRREDAVNYYEGIVNSKNISPEQLKSARFSLLYARLRKWRRDTTQSTVPIMELLDKLCGDNVNFDSMSYRDRRGMTIALKYWQFFARLNNKEVQTGIAMAEKWKEACRSTNQCDPRPAYNLYVLNYLKALDGFDTCVDEAEKYRTQCDHLAEQSKGVFGRKQTVRDCLVSGIKMGRLCPCSRDTMLNDQTKLIKLAGRLGDCSAGIGHIQVTRPEPLFGRDAKFRLSSKVSVSERQKSHNVEFYGAFTYEQLTAYYDIVADIDTKEKLTEMFGAAIKDGPAPSHPGAAAQAIVPAALVKNADFAAPVLVISSAKTKKTMDDSVTIPYVSEQVRFYPERIFTRYMGEGKRRYLNGSIVINEEKFKAGFDINDLSSLDGNVGNPIDRANEILSSMEESGFTVYCKPNKNGCYSVLIEKSFSSIEALMADVTAPSGPRPESSKQDSAGSIDAKEETKPKPDYSFLKDKTVDFVCEKQEGKRIAGKFIYDGQEYKGMLNCTLKDSKTLLGKTVKATVAIAHETVILNRV